MDNHALKQTNNDRQKDRLTRSPRTGLINRQSMHLSIRSQIQAATEYLFLGWENQKRITRQEGVEGIAEISTASGPLDGLNRHC